MVGAIASLLILLVGAGLLVAPEILLLLGWWYMRARRYERADTCATLAGLTSVGQFVVVGSIAALFFAIHDAHPAAMAVILGPAALWALSRVLHRSIRVQREVARRDRPYFGGTLDQR